MRARERGLVGVLAAVLAGAGAAVSTPASAAAPATANPATAPLSPSATPPLKWGGQAAVALAPGGDTWHWQNPSPDGETLFAIKCPSTTVCFAAGADGIVRATTNGGSTWSQQAAVGGQIFGLSCIDATHCVGVGVSTTSSPGTALAISTADGGVNWAAQNILGTQYLLAVSCPTVTTCVAVGASGEVLTESSGTWTLQTPPTTSTLYSVTCPTATGCVAVGAPAAIFTTGDGGMTWTGRTSPSTAGLFGVTCPSNTNCDAVGDKGLFVDSTDGGATWQLLTNTGSPLYGVACPDTTHCFVAGADGNVYFQNPSSSPLGVASTPEGGALYSIVCPTLTQCLAAGSFATIVATADGGTVWAKQATTPGPVRGLSCPDATHCFASGWNNVDAGFVLASADAGATWTTQLQLPTGAPTNLESISCADLTDCVAVGTGGHVVTTTDGGAHWTSQAPPTTVVLFAVSCPSATLCFAGGQQGTLLKTMNGGVSWSAQASGMTGELTGISCPTVTRCFASVSNIIDPVMGTTSGPGEIITFDGTSWSLSFNLKNDPNSGSTAPFNAIDCPSTTSCYAVGDSGLIAATGDGGVNWRTDNPPSNTFSGEGISCPTTTVCFAASGNDQAIVHTANAGGTWTMDWGGVFGESWQGIRCMSATTCIVAGFSIARTTTAGTASWNLQAPAGSTAPISGLSCTDSRNCYGAAGDTLLVTHDSGATWSSHTLTTTDFVLSISCPIAGTCVAVGWPGAIYATADAGATWTYRTNPLSGVDETLESVSCASTTTCVAVGGDGKVLSSSNGGATWITENSGTTSFLAGVSCASNSSCVAVGAGGATLARTSGTWHAYPSGTAKNLEGVDCPIASICYAVGAGGTVIKTGDGGATWTVLTSGTSVILNAVRCASTTVCLAVGVSATAILTLDGTSWSDDSPPGANTLRAVAWSDLNNAWLGGNGGTIFINQDVTAACGSVSGGPLPASPQTRGTVVTISATANGCPNPTYEIWMLPPGGGWTLLSGWSKSSAVSWDSSNGATGSYHFSVWARDLSSSNTYDSFFAFDYTLTATVCSGINVTASPGATSVQRGQPEQFTGATTGCPNPRYEFWMLPPGGSWALAQAYSPNPSFYWSTFVPAGTYRFSVWVRDASNVNSYDAFSAFDFTIISSACTGMSASASPPTSATVGTQVTITGTATGCSYAYYEFWLLAPGGTWRLAQPYMTVNTYSWSTTGLAAGTYRFSVWAQDGTSPGSYQAFSAFDYVLNATPCGAMSASGSPAGSASIGTMVTVSGAAMSCPSPLYEFWLHTPSGAWTLVQPYGRDGTFMWHTTGWPAGTYRFSVWARDGSSSASYDTFAAFDYTLTVTPCTAITATPSPGAPQPVGTTVTITATASGCTNPQFEFWLKFARGNWVLVQPYGGSNTFTWTGTQPGSYRFSVWVRDVSSSASYDTFQAFDYSLF